MNKKAIIAVSVIMVAMAAGVITLGVLFGKEKKARAETENVLEAHYQQSYYTLLDETNDLEIKFAKLTVARGKTTRLSLLSNAVKSGELAVCALSALSGSDVSIENTMRFLNQTGDFSAYLKDKLESGGEITAEENTAIGKIHEMLKTLSQELNKVKDKISEGYLFVNGANDKSDVLSDVFAALNDPSVEYPQLIYDGPFSDGRNDKTAKGLPENEVTQEQATAVVTDIFGDKIQNLNFLGQWGGDIETYNFDCTLSGVRTTLQVSMRGGTLLNVSGSRDVTNPVLSVEDCVEKAKVFLDKCGFHDMHDVWSANDDSTVYINFAPVLSDGTILYPDLVKVKIAADNGDVLGMDAVNYAFNHVERKTQTPTVSRESAKAKVGFDNASDGRLCVIPYKTNSERLCYEFIVESGGIYYIYIDAETGEEINILYVISTTGGDKLI